MLVDLARNDLSRNCTDVKIEAYKEIQHFSHVIHLVSKVTGQCNSAETFKTVSQAFPAGTLSGTPKPRALELINLYEPQSRGFYGGAVGMIQPNGDANMAIVIRSILSKENQLHYEVFLQNGSLLLMSGSTQHHWLHEIPRTAKPIGPRINLTFRVIKN